MARHMRNGRDYSRPGPKVDYELRKDSNNAARSGDVYDKIEEIQSQIVPTASIDSGATASKTYNVGDFLVKEGILYKVTKDIAKYDALTVGTNIDMTTVSSELNSISGNLLIKGYIDKNIGDVQLDSYGYLDIRTHKPTNKNVLLAGIKTFGASANARCFNITSDGNYIIGGGSDSISSLVIRYYYG